MTMTRRLSTLALSSALLLVAVLPTFAHANPKTGATAPAVMFLSQGKTLSLNAYHGQKVMLWLFSTWCPSCQAGLAALAQQQKTLAAGHVQLVVLENYQNGGYSGPSLQALMHQYADTVSGAPNWTIGSATQKLAAVYNTKSYPDIYYLIGKDGKIESIGSAPSANMDQILAFAGQ